MYYYVIIILLVVVAFQNDCLNLFTFTATLTLIMFTNLLIDLEPKNASNWQKHGFPLSWVETMLLKEITELSNA